MSSPVVQPEVPDLVCELDNVQGIVDAFSSVRWKRHQVGRTPSLLNPDALVELSEHGIVLIVEESGCLQAKVYLQRELFIRYEYGAQGRPRFGVSLGLFVDCLNTFSVPGHVSTIEIKYPGPDMQLLLKSVDSLDACIYAEIRTRIPDTISWDYNFEPAGTTPLTFTVKIDFMYYANTDLLVAFHCDHQVSYRYKYKYLKATTSNIPSSVIKENRGSKLTIGRGGMLKVQHLVSVARPFSHTHIDSSGYNQPSRIAYIEFYVKPEEREDAADGS
ncbi:uncharacterized protein LOC110811581 isoform X3 [Carica papaya]|uniref:uncharacterized protein LOC110811581 isoform X3 n=1 Tax=Carica papaya TaxID=3649 RepID=UPI000B8D0E72|nr:uncharacterized protein LOC110811581 isoform X3 [Carica papaya]